jgi:hypothetical protein
MPYANDLLFLETRQVEKSDWLVLCGIVADEGVVRVTFKDGTSDFRAKLTMPDAKPLRDGGVDVRFYWKECDETMIPLRKGVDWTVKKLKQFV